MPTAQYPYYLAGRPEQPNVDLEVRDEYRGNARPSWRGDNMPYGGCGLRSQPSTFRKGELPVHAIA